jgi:hypothetical protein
LWGWGKQVGRVATFIAANVKHAVSYAYGSQMLFQVTGYQNIAYVTSAFRSVHSHARASVCVLVPTHVCACRQPLVHTGDVGRAQHGRVWRGGVRSCGFCTRAARPTPARVWGCRPAFACLYPRRPPPRNPRCAPSPIIPAANNEVFVNRVRITGSLGDIVQLEAGMAHVLVRNSEGKARAPCLS